MTSSLTICVDAGGGRNIVFILDGVKETNLTVWSGSIISEIIIWKVADLSTAREEVFGAIWKSVFDRQLFDRDIDRAAQNIVARDPNSFVFVLLCSYGGTIACVADRVSVFQA